MPAPLPIVEQLVQGALNGMEAVEAAFGDKEVLSAAFTVVLRCADACIKNNESLRPTALQAAQVLMLTLANPGRPS